MPSVSGTIADTDSFTYDNAVQTIDNTKFASCSYRQPLSSMECERVALIVTERQVAGCSQWLVKDFGVKDLTTFKIDLTFEKDFFSAAKLSNLLRVSVLRIPLACQ